MKGIGTLLGSLLGLSVMPTLASRSRLDNCPNNGR